MILKKLVEYLDSNNVKYVSVTHSTAFTAQDVAQSAHIPGKEMAKTVVVWMDGTMAMAVLPASLMVDFNKLKESTGAKSVELASESEFKDRFPECEVGAMPPFGSLFNIKSDVTGYFLLGELVEIGETRGIFTNPRDPRTEDYITGRFG